MPEPGQPDSLTSVPRAERRWLAALALAALAYGLALALVVPLWQAPDEPMLFEYAALTARLGRIPSAADRSPELEQAIVASMNRNGFYRSTLGADPHPEPRTMEEAQRLFWMPRQVGGDPPAAFAASAAALALAAPLGLTGVDGQALLLRLLNVALLPATVLCAYGAARELRLGLPGLGLAVAALVALQPMLAASAATVGNDAPANLIGAGLCWAWLRIAGRGVTARRAGLALGLLALGLLTKRTLLPYAAVTAAAAAVWALRRRRAAAGLAALALLAAAGLAAQLDWGRAWGWYWYGGHTPAGRVWLAGGPALQIAPGQAAVQPLPAVAVDRARGASMRFGARVWSDGDADGRLIVINDSKRADVGFSVRGRAVQVETSASVYPQTRAVAIAVEADRGTIYAADIWAEAGGVPLAQNGSLSLPGVRPGAPLLAALEYLRLPDLAWSLGRGAPWRSLPERWGELLFASFWGHFGWMDVPFVLGSPWAWALGAFCLAGLAGLPAAIRRAPAGPARAQLWLLCWAAGVALALPLLNALAMPALQAPQQGRYLFPALAPLALLTAAGQASLLPARLRGMLPAAWGAGALTLAASALALLARHYAR